MSQPPAALVAPAILPLQAHSQTTTSLCPFLCTWWRSVTWSAVSGIFMHLELACNSLCPPSPCEGIAGELEWVKHSKGSSTSLYHLWPLNMGHAFASLIYHLLRVSKMSLQCFRSNVIQALIPATRLQAIADTHVLWTWGPYHRIGTAAHPLCTAALTLCRAAVPLMDADLQHFVWAIRLQPMLVPAPVQLMLFTCQHVSKLSQKSRCSTSKQMDSQITNLKSRSFPPDSFWRVRFHVINYTVFCTHFLCIQPCACWCRRLLSRTSGAGLSGI